MAFAICRIVAEQHAVGSDPEVAITNPANDGRIERRPSARSEDEVVVTERLVLGEAHPAEANRSGDLSVRPPLRQTVLLEPQLQALPSVGRRLRAVGRPV